MASTAKIGSSISRQIHADYGPKVALLQKKETSTSAEKRLAAGCGIMEAMAAKIGSGKTYSGNHVFL